MDIFTGIAPCTRFLPRATRPADWPAPEQLGFGQYLGPYMVVADHDVRLGWSHPRVETRVLSAVASGGLQYGLSAFEGLKAYRAPDDSIHLFRPREHASRLRQSCERLALPTVDESRFVEACTLATQVHEALIPPHGRGALYLRPTVFACEEALGFRVASQHRMVLAVTPCADPAPRTIRLWADRELTRAAPGGLGAAKTGGNYAAGMLGMLRARERGYDDVAWLDANTHTRLGEAGTMNLFVEIDHTLCTPPLDGTILAGITRDTLMQALRNEGLKVEERELPLDELGTLERAGRLGCAFGVGTAVRLVRIAEIGHPHDLIRFRDPGRCEHLRRILKNVQEGQVPQQPHWRLAVGPS
ncbi:MAG: aminotransferase class IV [Panacagrimonas sp.]